MTEDKNEKSRSALLSKIMSGDFSGTDTEDDDIPLARYSAGHHISLPVIATPSNLSNGAYLIIF